MSKLDKTLKEMEKAPQNVRFNDLARVCAHYFRGTSHHVYKTPWQGDPRVNIQKARMEKLRLIKLGKP